MESDKGEKTRELGAEKGGNSASTEHRHSVVDDAVISLYGIKRIKRELRQLEWSYVVKLDASCVSRM